MNAISELIVYLWLLPVTLFVILPLALSLVWSLAKSVVSLWELLATGGSRLRESALAGT